MGDKAVSFLTKKLENTKTHWKKDEDDVGKAVDLLRVANSASLNIGINRSRAQNHLASEDCTRKETARVNGVSREWLLSRVRSTELLRSFVSHLTALPPRG